jgi:hypothetical protein
VRALAAGEIAWLAVVPCAAALVAAIVLLGPPLGRLLTPSSTPAIWELPYFVPRPEPVEHARFLLALLGPLLLSAVVVARAQRPAWRSSLLTTLAGQASQALLVGFLVVCVVAQHRILYDEIYGGPLRRVFFTWRTLGVALALALLFAAAVHARRVTARLVALARETPPRRLLCGGLALLATAAWLLTAIEVQSSAGGTNFGVSASMPFWLDETFAVLDGRTPLVDFDPQYAQLWPYIAASAMSLFGTSLGVYTIVMACGSGAGLIAVFAIFRRILRSSAAALAVYLPFLATGFFMELGPLANRYGPSNLLSMFPMRYAGPYLLAWLTARHLDRLRPRRLALLFLVAGIVVVNNPEFGLPALGATLAALAVTRARWTRSTLRQLLGAAALGVGGAIVLFSLLTLLRSGSLPHPEILAFFAKLYGVVGFGMLPMPTIGFHLVLYATFTGAIVLATVRAVTRHDDVLLTGMLAWIGVFGLGAGSYFAGRSHPEVLIDLFSAWAFALVLLLIVAVRAILARPSRWPRLAELAVLIGVGICACSLAQFPTPWSQIERLRHHAPAPYYDHVEAVRFVARTTRAGERVAILIVPGHRIAYDAGVVNVTPYAGWESMPLKQQVSETVDALRRAHGHKLYMTGMPDPKSAFERLLLRRGGLELKATGEDLLEFGDRSVPRATPARS